MAPSLVSLGPFAPHGPWVVAVTNAGERYLPLVKPYDAAMHLGHMASYREALRYSHGRRVLDLGCGTGYGAYFLASHGARRVSAVDLSAECLGYGATVYRHPRLSYLRADASRLPFASASFDFVFSSQVIEHVPSPERFLREIKRVLTPDGFCLITTPNRRLFSPSGPSGNVHHLSEMDVTTYAATAGRVFPRVEIRGIPQRSLTLHPDQSMPSARPNAEIRPEDYRVQKTDVEQCENLLCFAHADPAGSFAHSLPAALEPVADELAPLFWDPTSCAWVVLGIHPDGRLATVPLRLGQEVRVSFRSPYGDLYRVELDTVGSLDVPVRVTLRDADGRLVAAGEVEPEQDRVVVAFAPQPASRDRAYTLAIRLQFGAGVLRHLFAPAQLAGRIVSDRVGIAIRTFHARHSAGSSPGSPFGSAEKGPRAALRCSPDGGP